MDLGLVTDLVAEAFGEPGNRTFRLMAETAEGAVSLWLEKEQIVALGSALEELLERISGGQAPVVAPTPVFVGELEVRVGSLTLAFDGDRGGFVIEASDFISPFDFESIRFMTSREHLRRVEEQIERIVAAGRPRCPLCGTPLSGEPHFCPPSNGHAHLVVEE